MNKKIKNHQYKIGDYMKHLLWNLFRNTGKVEYYLKMKEVEKNENNNTRKKI